jgi:hypothetical protein
MIEIHSSNSGNLSIIFSGALIFATYALQQVNAMEFALDDLGATTGELPTLSAQIQKGDPSEIVQSLQKICNEDGFAKASDLLRSSLKETRRSLCDIKDEHNNSILYQACAQGLLDCVKIILSVAKERNQIMLLLTMLNEFGEMALVCAKRFGYTAIADVIIRSGRDCGLELRQYAKISGDRSAGVHQISARYNSPV